MPRGSRALALTVALLSLAGCTRPPTAAVDAGAKAPAGPRAVAEVEPNGDAAHAQKLTGAVDVAGTLAAPAGKKADADWYALDPALGSVAVRVDPAPPLDVVLELYDADGVKRMTQDAALGGGSEVIHGVTPIKAAFVRVVSKDKAPGAYHLEVTPEPPSAVASTEQEPDDRAADASALVPGAPVRGYLSDPGDDDWYALQLSSADGGSDAGAAAMAPAAVGPVDAGSNPALAVDGGAVDAGAVDAGPPPAPPTLLHLTVTGVPGVRLEVSVVNAAEAVLFKVRGGEPGQGVEVRNLALRAPDRAFYVVVRSAWVGAGKQAKRFASMDVPYQLTAELSVAQGQVELEPDDDVDHATPVSLTTGQARLTGFLTPASDVDAFRITSAAPMIARAEVSGVPHLDLALSVVDAPDGGRARPLLTADEGELKEPEVLTNLAVGPGGLLLQIRGAARKGPDGKWRRDTENAQDPYTLTLTAVPDDGAIEREPNNTPATATAVKLGQTLRGNVDPRRDEDLYRLDLSAQPVKTPIRAQVSGILKVDVALYLYRQEPDGSTQLVQTSDQGKGDASESITYAADPGVYFLKVKDARDRASNFVDSYLLRVAAP